MDHTDGMINFKMIGEDLCLVDSCTTHTILRDKKYFQYLILNKASVNTISGSLKALEERISYCQKEQNFVLTMLCILLNIEEIKSFLRIFV
jgi:hypothetical protein